MPEMDGLEATRRIRQMEPSRQPRIFAMTASTLDSERQQCIDAGMEQHIAKPIRKQVLADALAGVQRRDAMQGPHMPAAAVAVADRLAASEHEPATPSARSEGLGDGNLARALDEQAEALDREGVVELIDALVKGLEPSARRLRESASNGDAIVLKRTAHTMKSNAAMLGADALSDRLDTLERAAKAGPLGDEARIEIEAIARDYAQLIEQAAALRSRYL